MWISLNNIQLTIIVRTSVLLMFLWHFRMVRVERYFGNNRITIKEEKCDWISPLLRSHKLVDVFVGRKISVREEKKKKM